MKIIDIKKIIKKIMLVMVAIFVLSDEYSKVYAADASVVIALSSSTVSIGDTVTATITVSGASVSQYRFYVSYNAAVLEFQSASGATNVSGGGGTLNMIGGTGSTTFKFKAIANGSSNISTSGDEVASYNTLDENGFLSVSHAGATVTVATASGNNDDKSDSGDDGQTTETTEEDGRSSDCSLASLQVSPGTLSPAFSADRTTYSLQVDEDVTSVVVSASAADSKATTSVSGANSIQKGKNTVRITVTAENGAVRVYTINVQAGEDVGDPVATIDGTEYAFVMSEDGLEAPEGFTAGTTTYKDWDVLSFQSPNKKITVVCLKDEEGENHWFIMDAERDIFTPYQEYSSQYNRYIIMDAPEGTAIPEGFTATKIRIGETEVTAYQSANVADADLYLVYAVNVEGEEGFYEYDAKEQAFLRYVPMTVTEEVYVEATPSQATPTNVPQSQPKTESPFKNPVVIGILVSLVLILVVLIVVLVIFAGRINRQNKDILDAEDMIAQLANANKDVNPELLAKLGLDEATLNGTDSAAGTVETADEKTELINFGEEKTAEPEGETTILKAPQPEPSTSTLSEDVNELVEEVNRDFAASIAGGESYVEKSEKELAHEDYEKRSMEINNRIMTDYDSQKDSVFADETAGEKTSAPDAENAADAKE